MDLRKESGCINATLWKTISGGIRFNSEVLWQEYLQNKQTYKEIGIRYGVNESTIKRKIRKTGDEWYPIIPGKEGFLLLNATYFGRNWAILAAIDAQKG